MTYRQDKTFSNSSRRYRTNGKFESSTEKNEAARRSQRPQDAPHRPGLRASAMLHASYRAVGLRELRPWHLSASRRFLPPRIAGHQPERRFDPAALKVAEDSRDRMESAVGGLGYCRANAPESQRPGQCWPWPDADIVCGAFRELIGGAMHGLQVLGGLKGIACSVMPSSRTHSTLERFGSIRGTGNAIVHVVGDGVPLLNARVSDGPRSAGEA